MKLWKCLWLSLTGGLMAASPQGGTAGCEDALFLDGDISDFAVQVTPETRFRPQTYAAMLVLPRAR